MKPLAFVLLLSFVIPPSHSRVKASGNRNRPDTGTCLSAPVKSRPRACWERAWVAVLRLPTPIEAARNLPRSGLYLLPSTSALMDPRESGIGFRAHQLSVGCLRGSQDSFRNEVRRANETDASDAAKPRRPVVENEELNWNGAQASVYVTRYGGKVTSGIASISLNEYSERQSEARKQKMKDGAKDL